MDVFGRGGGVVSGPPCFGENGRTPRRGTFAQTCQQKHFKLRKLLHAFAMTAPEKTSCLCVFVCLCVCAPFEGGV